MTEAELVVLSLVVEQPRHAYEIEQVIAEREMRDWTDIGFSSIYYVLRKMELAGLVRGRQDAAASRGPARTTYSPTSAGVAAWTQASLAALATARVRTPFLLGLSNLAGLPAGDALAAARSCLAELNRHLEQVSEKRRELDEPEWFVAEVFDYSEQTLRCGRDWVAGLVGRLETRARTQMSTRTKSLKPFTPEIAELPDRLMAVASTTGDPNLVVQAAFPALYGAVYARKFALKKEGIEFKVEAVRGRFAAGVDFWQTPRDQWRAEWAIPVPDGTTEVVQKDPAVPVQVETWQYGTVAQVLHVGAYADETPTIQKLLDFIDDEGWQIIGPHEEEYRSRPGPNAKTVIRYQVARRD